MSTSEAKTEGGPHLYFLSDYVLRGYALKERKWREYSNYNQKVSYVLTYATL